MRAATGLLLGAVFLLGSMARTEQTPDADEEVLQHAGLETDNASLLAFLRGHCRDTVDRREVDRLVERLGDSSFQEREKATEALVQLEAVAVPALRRARQQADDAEVRRRAKKCLEQIEDHVRQRLPLAAVRLVLKRGADGTVETLIRYLPSVEDAAVEKEICFGLDRLTKQQRRIDPALRAALKDEQSSRRALAACILGARGNAEERKAVAGLLEDRDAGVRLRAAQGLLSARQKEGIPTLIRLLEDPAIEVCWQAEELLCWAAWAEAPAEVVGTGSVESKRKARAAWWAWWQARGPALDLGKELADFRRPGLVYAVAGDDKSHWIELYGCDNRARGRLGTMPKSSYDPWSMQLILGSIRLIPGARVWSAEEQTSNTERGTVCRAIERDLEGRVVWEYKSGRDRGLLKLCERLPNGNLLLLWQDRAGGDRDGDEVTAVEVGRDKKETVRWRIYFDIGSDPVAWTLLPNGNLLGWQARLRPPWEIDLASGKKTERFGFANEYKHWHHIEVLPERRLLIVHAKGTTEVDLRGQATWTCDKGTEKGCWGATRLDNGDTLLMVQEKDHSWVHLQLDPSERPVAELLAKEGLRDYLGLVRLGFDGPPAGWRVDSLASRLQQLRRREVAVRLRAVAKLKDMGTDVDAVVSALIDAFTDSEPQVVEQAMRALFAIGPVCLPHLRKALHDPRARVRARAAGCVGEGQRWKWKQAAALVPDLIGLLRDESPEVRARAAGSLGLFVHNGLAPKADVAIPELLRLIKDENEEVAVAAVWALAGFAPKTATVVPVLVESLRDKRAGVVKNSAWALGTIGLQASSAVPALMKVARRKEEDVRFFVFDTLGKVGVGKEEVAELLAASMFQEENAGLRWKIAQALGEMGPRTAKVAVPALRKGLKNKRFRANARGAMAAALGKMGAEGRVAIPDLIEALKDRPFSEETQVVSRGAARGLGKLRPVSREAVEALIEMVRPRQGLTRENADQLEHRRSAAVEALGCMGQEARTALPVLKAASVEMRWWDGEKVYIDSREAAVAAGKDKGRIQSWLNEEATEAIRKITRE